MPKKSSETRETALPSPATPPVDDITLRVPSHVVYRSFPDETVALNLETGSYHGLNAMAAEMLELINEHGSVRETARIVAERYGAPQDSVEADVRELVAKLRERDLLEIVDRP